MPTLLRFSKKPGTEVRDVFELFLNNEVFRLDWKNNELNKLRDEATKILIDAQKAHIKYLHSSTPATVKLELARELDSYVQKIKEIGANLIKKEEDELIGSIYARPSDKDKIVDRKVIAENAPSDIFKKYLIELEASEREFKRVIERSATNAPKYS